MEENRSWKNEPKSLVLHGLIKKETERYLRANKDYLLNTT